MYIVVSSDGRIPKELMEANTQVELWTVQEFYEHASSDDGLTVEEGLFYDVSVLTEEIYEALQAYDEEDSVLLVYYKYDDKPNPVFNMNHEIRVYSSIEEVEEEEELPESIIEEVIEEPEPEIEPEPEPEPPIKSSQVSSPISNPVSQPIQQPVYTPPVQPVYQQPVYTPPVQPQPVYNQQAYVPPANNVLDLDKKPEETIKSKSTVKKTAAKKDILEDKITRMNIDNMLMYDEFDTDPSTRRKKKKAPAKVILFGSSKGGTGKTFTCLATAYWYAKMHPTERIALADFDIIDGQIGITINKMAPTVFDYYKDYKDNLKEFSNLRNHSKVTSDKFSTNIDFYLAPPQDIPQVTNDLEFWNDLFQKLIENYDVVFFDSGIDYLGKPPISQLYKIADRIIITCNPSINSTKSVLKQFKTLSGQRINTVFRPNDGIMSRVRIVLTRVDPESESINAIVEKNLSKFAPIVAKFENIDKVISQIQWYQFWDLIDQTPTMREQLDKIINFDDEED